MLGILLLILKIIGIIILSILGLVLFLLLVILLVPIRYEAEVSFINKKPAGIAGVHWLMRLLQVHFSFGKDVNGLQIKIAGKMLGGKAKKKKASSASASKKKQEKESEQPVLPDSLMPEEQREINQELLKDAAQQLDENEQLPQDDSTCGQKTQEIEDEAALFETAQENEDNPSAEDMPKEPLSEKMQKICDSITAKLNSLNEKRLWVASLLEYLQTEPMKQSLGKLKANLIKILLHILPQKGKIDLKLGFKNPATTGQILGILGMLYPRFHGNLSVTPYFDRSILEGEVAFKGRIRLMTLVIVAVKTVLDKNIRTFIKKVRNGGKK